MYSDREKCYSNGTMWCIGTEIQTIFIFYRTICLHVACLVYHTYFSTYWTVIEMLLIACHFSVFNHSCFYFLFSYNTNNRYALSLRFSVHNLKKVQTTTHTHTTNIGARLFSKQILKYEKKYIEIYYRTATECALRLRDEAVQTTTKKINEKKIRRANYNRVKKKRRCKWVWRGANGKCCTNRKPISLSTLRFPSFEEIRTAFEVVWHRLSTFIQKFCVCSALFCFLFRRYCWWLCSSNKPAIIEIIFFLLHGKREVGCIWQTIDCKCECAQHVHLLCALCVVCLLRLRFSAENKFSADLIIIFSDIWQTHLSMIFELPHIHRPSIAWENYAQEISSDI